MKHKFKLTTKKGRTMFTEAVDEKAARTSFARKARRYNILPSEVYRSEIEDLGPTEMEKSLKNNTDLLSLLKKETESLKKQYLELTEKYAEEKFENLTEKDQWPQSKWYKLYQVEVETRIDKFSKKEHTTPVSAEYHKKNLYKMQQDQRNTRKIVQTGLEKFKAAELKKAEDHYENSIQKLAFRIDQKNLNSKKITLKTSHIGVNIDTIITDGNITVHAYTIIASGPIQRPHYRYLIK